MNDRLHNRHYLKKNRKALRNNLTPAEARLWNFLQKSQLRGRKFRRQHSVQNYILDFYCPSEKLAVELDGAHHYTAKGIASDEKRDAYLMGQGITVIRFENEEVFHAIESILEKIAECFGRPPLPLLEGGE